MVTIGSMGVEDAELVALQALTYLAGDEARLGRFLSLTGLSPHDLHARANTLEIQVATLGHLMGNESELLVFSSQSHVSPQDVVAAHNSLSGKLSE